MRSTNNPFQIPDAPGKRWRISARSGEWLPSAFGAPAATGGTDNNARKYVGSSVDATKIRIFAAIAITCFTILFAQALRLQVLEFSQLAKRAQANFTQRTPIVPLRGLILDRKGQVLAENKPAFALFTTPQFRKLSPEQVARLTADIGRVLDPELTALLSENITQRKESTNERPLLIDIPYAQAIALRVALQHSDAVSILPINRRVYTSLSPSLAHVLGYVSLPNDEDLTSSAEHDPTQFIGRTGLEAQYEATLAGVAGYVETTLDAQSRTQGIATTNSATPGRTLATTIDRDVQVVAEQALREQLTKQHKQRGVVVAIEPKTGGMLAMVSLPTFDATALSRGLTVSEYQALASDTNFPFINRATSGEYPPGSTFKLVMAAAGLAEHLITAQTTVLSTGGLRIGAWFFPDWKAGGHGLTNVRKAIADSVNTFFYRLGGGYENQEGLGIARIGAYAARFGLGKPLGIDIPGEGDGHVPTPEWKLSAKHEPWYIGDTYHVSIGQGDLLLTPLQIANVVATIANGGVVHRPHFVASAEAEAPLLADPVCDVACVRTVQQGMEDAVSIGSARALRSLGTPVAGKTGTAQAGDATHAWFVGYAPAQNPQIAVAVLIEEGGEGSSAAVPVAQRIFDFWLHPPSATNSAPLP